MCCHGTCYKASTVVLKRLLLLIFSVLFYFVWVQTKFHPLLWNSFCNFSFLSGAFFCCFFLFPSSFRFIFFIARFSFNSSTYVGTHLNRGIVICSHRNRGRVAFFSLICSAKEHISISFIQTYYYADAWELAANQRQKKWSLTDVSVARASERKREEKMPSPL